MSVCTTDTKAPPCVSACAAKPRTSRPKRVGRERRGPVIREEPLGRHPVSPGTAHYKSPSGGAGPTLSKKICLDCMNEVPGRAPLLKG
jgi:hypothetical protein